MRSKPDNKSNPQTGGPLRQTDQVVVAICVLVGLLALAGYWIHRSTTDSRLIDIDQAEPLQAQFQLDINSADWPEFAQLPGIGEVLARRIVEERQRQGIFLDHDDLRERVRGIGPTSIERIRPFLLPLPDASNVAGDQDNRPGSYRGS